MLTITNATKAHVIAAVNAVLGMLAAFNVGSLSHEQAGAIVVAANAILAALVAVTYKQSKKRAADPAPAPVVPIA